MSDNHEKADKSSEDHDEKEENHSGVLEKIFTVLSLVLLGSLCAFLVWQSFAPSLPPSFQVELGPFEKRGDYVGVEIIVSNIGDEAAKAVQVLGETTGADGEPVDAQATMDWLPGDSKRRVTLIFPADVKQENLDVRIAGYEEP